MHIFVTVRHSSDPKFYYGELWSSNFYSALRKLGHEIIESQIDLLLASQMRRAQERIEQFKERIVRPCETDIDGLAKGEQLVKLRAGGRVGVLHNSNHTI